MFLLVKSVPFCGQKVILFIAMNYTGEPKSQSNIGKNALDYQVVVNEIWTSGKGPHDCSTADNFH